jgi:hypothetical protein
VVELCPKCASEEITDPYTGWGPKCASEAVVERYVAREREAVEDRRGKWKQRSASETPEALRERQRRHRLYAALQPKERPGPYTDPWELAFEGLQHLGKIRSAALKGTNGQQHLDAVQECIRQLAVGPED